MFRKFISIFLQVGGNGMIQNKNICNIYRLYLIVVISLLNYVFLWFFTGSSWLYQYLKQNKKREKLPYIHSGLSSNI